MYEKIRESSGKINYYKNKPKEYQELQTWDKYPEMATRGHSDSCTPSPAWGRWKQKARGRGEVFPLPTPHYFPRHPCRKRTAVLSANRLEKRADGDSQVLGLLGVQAVPVAALRGQRGGRQRVGRAHRRGAAQEAALGGIGDGNRGPAALVVRHRFSCTNGN